MRGRIASIQWRIFLYYTALLALSGALLAGGHFWTEWQEARQWSRLRMWEAGVELLPFVFPPPENAPEPPEDPAERIARPGPVTSPSFLRRAEELTREGFFLVAANWKGEEIFRSANAPRDFRVLDSSAPPVRMARPPGTLTVAVPSIVGDVVALGCPLSLVEKQLLWSLPLSLTFALLVVAGASLVGFHLIRIALGPIKEISRAAVQVSQGNLSERIQPPSRGSELGQLAAVLNTSFDRVEAMLKRQTEFLADVSHELRTPVAIILAESEFVRKQERPPERYREAIEVFHQSSLHMKKIIEDLLVLSRFDAPDSAPGAPPLRHCDLAVVADRARKLVAVLAREHDVTLVPELGEAPCHGDPDRLQHIVFNLLSNAIRYNVPKGCVWIRTGSCGDEVFLEVEDTGVGIPGEKLGRIFERFFRVDESRNDVHGGAGLGLSICKTLVESLGGRIEVSSTPGKGSIFRVLLKADRDLAESLGRCVGRRGEREGERAAHRGGDHAGNGGPLDDGQMFAEDGHRNQCSEGGLET